MAALTGEARSNDTKTNMAARLRAIATELQSGPANQTMVKMIFDLKGAAGHLDDLDELIDAIEDWERTTPNAQRPSILALAREIRERKSKGSDPEPKMG